MPVGGVSISKALTGQGTFTKVHRLRRSKAAAKNPSVPWRCGDSLRYSPVSSAIRCASSTFAQERGWNSGCAARKGRGHRLVFLLEQAAGGVDQPPARLQQAARRGEDAPLLLHQLVDSLRAVAPFQLGIAPQGAEAAARRIDQDPVELAGEALDARVLARGEHHRMHVGDAGARARAAQATRAASATCQRRRCGRCRASAPPRPASCRRRRRNSRRSSRRAAARAARR